MPSPLPQHGSQQRTSHHRQRDPQTVMGKGRRTEHRQTYQPDQHISPCRQQQRSLHGAAAPRTATRTPRNAPSAQPP